VALINFLFAGQPTVGIILVGHSMGGAIATHVCASERVAGVDGLVVIDVVEGTAMASLKTMPLYIAKLPTSFPSPEKAIQWSVKSNATRRKKSARVSVPPRVVYNEERGEWLWRTDLKKSEVYWEEWYAGLSNKFLACKGRKVLLLAGTDRLDTALTIGQMQGKFRLVVLPDCRHCLQEDDPKYTAQVLMEMTKRFALPRVVNVLT